MKNKKSPVKTALKSIEKSIAKTPALPVKTIAATSAAPASPTPVALAPKAPKPVTEAKPVLTTIEVKLDVGFGNAVFLRGQGAGLTWERGLPLACVDAKTWRWSAEARDTIKFKLLINDQIWSAGNDLLIAPGQKIEVAPQFA